MNRNFSKECDYDVCHKDIDGQMVERKIYRAKQVKKGKPIQSAALIIKNKVMARINGQTNATNISNNQNDARKKRNKSIAQRKSSKDHSIQTKEKKVYRAKSSKFSRNTSRFNEFDFISKARRDNEYSSPRQSKESAFSDQKDTDTR